MDTIANVASAAIFTISALTVGWSVWNTARHQEDAKKEVAMKKDAKETELV